MKGERLMRRWLGVTSFPSLLAMGVLALLAGVSVGLAQETFPSRPITFVVGFAPGGGADVLGRALADASKTTLPRPLVVENRPGAGGTNAAAYAMGRPPDGYTILFGHAGSTILTPTIGNTPNLKWDAFEPVARIQGEEEFLFLRPGLSGRPSTRSRRSPSRTPGSSGSAARRSAGSTASSS
jgi:tripartite-type tricarboxylate transporter receptor subunit TctC